MARLKINASPLEGHKFYRAGGPDKAKYAWPRGDGYVLVDVVDQKEDPKPDPSHEVLRIGKDTYAELLAENKRGRLNIVAGDDPLGMAETAQQLVVAKERIADLESDLAFFNANAPKELLADLAKVKTKAAKEKAKA